MFDWPSDGKLLVPGLKNQAQKAYLLADPTQKTLATASSPEGLVITVPTPAPDAISSTIVLQVKGALAIEQPVLAQGADGSVTLPAAEAIYHGKQIKFEGGRNHDNIGYWLDPSEWVEWQFQVTRPGKFAVTADIAATGSGSFEVTLGQQIGQQKLACKAPNTGDYAKFQKVELGALELTTPGKVSLAVKAVKAGWKPFNLRSIKFTPAK